MAINFPASPSTNDTHTENAITWIFNGTSWDAQGDQVTAASIGLGNVDNTADADKQISTATQTALDMKRGIVLPSADAGHIPRQQNTAITVKDGGAKPYHAFPSAILIGTTVYATVCTMTGHQTRDSDVWLYTCPNYGAGEWTGTEIFSATGTAGAIVSGDKEYRYAGIHHLGGSKLIIAMHTWESGAVVATEWAVSTDLGTTWESLQSIPLQDGTYLATAGNPYLFNGRVFLGCYDGTGDYLLSQTLAEIEAGTNDQWRLEFKSNGTEGHLTTSYDGTELRYYSRVADIRLYTSSDGDTWSAGSYIGLPDWENTQPCVEELEDGTLVHIGRQNSLGLEARLFYKNAGAGQWIIENTPLVSNRAIPAWANVEKSMYGMILPFGGSMFGYFGSLEAHEEWNTISQSTGNRASVYYSCFAAGAVANPPINSFSVTARDFDPRDLDGCNMMLVPESLVVSGTDITEWTDISSAGHSITTDLGKEPQLAAAASPNGKDCVQGALSDYFVLAPAGGEWDVGSMYAVFNYPNANFNGFNAIIPNVMQGDGTTDNLKFGTYPSGFNSGACTINGVTYSGSTFDPTDWAEYGFRSLLSGASTEDRDPINLSSTTRLMTQKGFDTNRNWLGKLVCLVTFDRRLTDSEDAQMQTWLGLQ